MHTPQCLGVCYKHWREAVGYAMICKSENIEIDTVHLCLNPLMSQEHPGCVCLPLCTGAPASEKHLARTICLTMMICQRLTETSTLMVKAAPR